MRNTPESTTHEKCHLHLLLLISLLLALMNNINLARGTYTFIYAGCSSDKYQPNTNLQTFEINLNSLFTSTISSSSKSLYNAFAFGNNTSSSPPESMIYGLYQCRGDLRLSDCVKCVQTAVTQIGLICPYSYGATLQLDACLIKYEHFNFLGTQDLNMEYKKCSLKTMNGDLNFLKRRDDVLSQLGSSGLGFFRVTGGQGVEGYGQCLGDLSDWQCGQCLEEAARKMKVLCGASVAGDVFLGKCSVRYWASGYYDISTGKDDDDDVGKTVAIMVGVIAGVSIIIVGLSFCHKALG